MYLRRQARYLLLSVLALCCLILPSAKPSASAHALSELGLHLATFSDADYRKPSESFSAGDVIYVQVSLSGCAQAAPQGIEQLGWRIYAPSRLGQVRNLQPGQIIHSELAFGSNTLQARAGLTGAAFSLYNQYLADDSSGQAEPIARPLMADGVLASFQIVTTAETPAGNYGLIFGESPGELSLVIYNGKGHVPETSNLTPATDYLQTTGIQVQIKTPTTAVPPLGETVDSPATPVAGGSPSPENPSAESGQHGEQLPLAQPASQQVTPSQPLAFDSTPAPVVGLAIGVPGYTQNGERRDMVACYRRGADTMMPIRLLEAFAVQLQWDQTSKTATFTVNGRVVRLQVGSTEAQVDGLFKPIIAASGLRIAPELMSGRVMVPLRFVSENLGFRVQWSPPGEIKIQQ